MVSGSRLGVGVWLWVVGFGFRVSGLEFQVSSLSFKVSGVEDLRIRMQGLPCTIRMQSLHLNS